MKKRFFRFKKEYIKKKGLLTRELTTVALSMVLKSKNLRAGKQILAYNQRTRKLNKRKSIAYQTSLCMETGHYKSRINWGKTSRYSFKSTANKDGFFNLIKKSK